VLGKHYHSKLRGGCANLSLSLSPQKRLNSIQASSSNKKRTSWCSDLLENLIVTRMARIFLAVCAALELPCSPQYVVTLTAYIQAGIRTLAGTLTFRTGVSLAFLHLSSRQMTV
jgi:hypothetical protein